MSTQLPDGVSVGHWTDAKGLTGCTVLLVPGGAVAGVDVRGGAPGTSTTVHPVRPCASVQCPTDTPAGSCVLTCALPSGRPPPAYSTGR